MICVRFSVFEVFTFLLPSLVIFALGQQQLNQACILTTGNPGRCLRLKECPEIFKLYNREVIYPSERREITAVLGACGSDEHSSEQIVCCKPPELSLGRGKHVPTEKTTTPITRRPKQLKATINYDHYKDVLPQFCGKGNQADFNIVSNVQDDQNVHVWAVYIEINNRNNNNLGRCVGTLIQESFVLTAAHCIHHLSEKDIRLFFGVFKISECKTNNACQERSADKFIIHRGYGYHNKTNDIALIKLTEPVTNDVVVPACLPLNYTFDERSLTDTRVVSIGWGENEHRVMSDSKGLVVLNVSHIFCDHYLAKPRFAASITSSAMCTIGVTEGHDVCEGDSGAPLLHLRGEQYFVVGVVSFGPKCQMQIISGVSTRVSEYMEWILTNLKRSKWME